MTDSGTSPKQSVARWKMIVVRSRSWPSACRPRKVLGLKSSWFGSCAVVTVPCWMMPRPRRQGAQCWSLGGDRDQEKPHPATEDVTSSPLMSRVKPQVRDSVRDARPRCSLTGLAANHQNMRLPTEFRSVQCSAAIRPINAATPNVPHARMGPRPGGFWFVSGRWRRATGTPPIFWISHP